MEEISPEGRGTAHTEEEEEEEEKLATVRRVPTGIPTGMNPFIFLPPMAIFSFVAVAMIQYHRLKTKCVAGSCGRCVLVVV